jgi:hypothetical protein
VVVRALEGRDATMVGTVLEAGLHRDFRMGCLRSCLEVFLEGNLMGSKACLNKGSVVHSSPVAWAGCRLQAACWLGFEFRSVRPGEGGGM